MSVLLMGGKKHPLLEVQYHRTPTFHWLKGKMEEGWTSLSSKKESSGMVVSSLSAHEGMEEFCLPRTTARYSSSFWKFSKYGKYLHAFEIPTIASLRHETGESSFPRMKTKIFVWADLDVNAVTSRCVAHVRFNCDFFLRVHAWAVLSPRQRWPAKPAESENRGSCQRMNRFFCKSGASSFHLI